MLLMEALETQSVLATDALTFAEGATATHMQHTGELATQILELAGRAKVLPFTATDLQHRPATTARPYPTRAEPLELADVRRAVATLAADRALGVQPMLWLSTGQPTTIAVGDFTQLQITAVLLWRAQGRMHLVPIARRDGIGFPLPLGMISDTFTSGPLAIDLATLPDDGGWDDDRPMLEKAGAAIAVAVLSVTLAVLVDHARPGRSAPSVKTARRRRR